MEKFFACCEKKERERERERLLQFVAHRTSSSSLNYLFIILYVINHTTDTRLLGRQVTSSKVFPLKALFAFFLGGGCFSLLEPKGEGFSSPSPRIDVVATRTRSFSFSLFVALQLDIFSPVYFYVPCFFPLFFCQRRATLKPLDDTSPFPEGIFFLLGLCV